MSSTGLVAQPLKANGAFNWIYLVDWVVIGVLSLFFLFYFNRFFATVISYFIRLYTWRAFKVYIDIEAIQFSPLAGRIFFKGVRYHGDNITAFIHSGNITWRYWLPRTKQARIFQDENHSPSNEKEGSRASSSSGEGLDHKGRSEFDLGLDDGPPCRICVKVSGVEAFVYNRTPAYDFVVDAINKRDEANGTSKDQANATFEAQKTGIHAKHRDTVRSSSSSEPVKTATTESLHDEGATGATKTNPPFFLRLFPFYVECQKAAAVLGNENTPSIITAKVNSATGEFDASDSGPLDVFKILMGFDVSQPYIQMKPNVDYREPQLTEATEIKRRTAHEEEAETEEEPKSKRLSFFQRANVARWASKSLESVNITLGRNLQLGALPYTQLQTYGHERWHGLARYLNDTEKNEHDEWEDVEYAKASVIADLERVGFQFYWDIPGSVPNNDRRLEPEPEGRCEINGSAPPEYGMKLIVYGGNVVYGPWADRNRVIFQQIFFPGQFADSVPTKVLVGGESRICTVFKLALLVHEDTTVRIPFREPSKDASWKGRATTLTRQAAVRDLGKKPGRSRKGSVARRNRTSGMQGAEVRPFAWFDIKVKANTVIRFKQDMFPRTYGYSNDLDVAVSGVDISSSLNHALLWRSAAVSVKADLSYPLAWNGLRDWPFQLEINHVDMFLLRDHTFLLMDLIADWSKGPLPDFHTFVPYRYLLKVRFNDYKLYLNTNDANIINNSEDLEDNEFVILYGATLDTNLTIPIDRFRPAENVITFSVTSDDLELQLCMPPKNTLSALVTNNNVASLTNVELRGSFTGCTEVKPGLSDTLLFEIIGTGFEITMYGFLGRMLAKIKENYFGETVHFRTLEEYQALVNRDFEGADKDQPVIEGNDLDVILDIMVHDANILLPCGLYNADEYVRIHVDNADVDLRVNNYYLELMVNSSPIELNYKARSVSESAGGTARYNTSATQLFIDGLTCSGHRLFGLPPSEPAYISNWDIEAGNIVGDCQPAFFGKVAAAAQGLALGFGDYENAVPLPHVVPVHDTTFVRFGCPGLEIWCPVGDQAILFSSGAIGGNFNDYAGVRFSQRLNLNVPDLTLGSFDAANSSRKIQEEKPTKTLAYFKTSANVTMVQRNFQFQHDRQLQQQHIRDNDARCGNRCTFLVHEDDPSKDRMYATNDAISLPLPSLPAPIISDTESMQLRPATNVQKLQQSDGFGPTIHELSHKRPSAAGLPHSSIPLSSSFKMPHLNLHGLHPDLSDVPALDGTASSSSTRRSSSVGELEFDDSMNEDTVHTTVMIDLDPGISVFCTAEAVRIFAGMSKTLLPADATQMLDDLQFRTIMEVVATNSRQRGDSSITDISLKMPQMKARFINQSTSKAEFADIRSDRYLLVASQLGLAVRSKLVSGQREETDSTSLHTTLGRLKVEAQEGLMGQADDGAALESVIDDILVWLNISDHISVNTSFHNFEAALASKEVNYLASLIHRTTMLVDEFGSQFAQIFSDQDMKQKILLYELTRLGEDLSDPQFLTRPSYVIRSSQDHVRNSDSWKILSRFQSTIRSLTTYQLSDIDTALRAKDFALPADAEKFVLAALDAWRSWDAMRVRDSYIVRIVYGSGGDVEKLHDLSKVPTDVSVRGNFIKIVVDPGDKETSFSLDQLSAAVAVSPPPPPSALRLFHEYNEARSNVVQLRTSKIGLRVDWSVLDLVDRVLGQFERAAPATHHSAVTSNAASPEAAAIETFHIVLTSDLLRIDLVAINVAHELSIADLKTSITGSGWQQPAGPVAVNVILTSNTLAIALLGHERKLLRHEVVSPKLWVAYEQSVSDGTVADYLRVAGDSKEILFKTQDEIIGLLDIVQSVVKDEASYVRDLFDKHAGILHKNEQEVDVPNKRPNLKLDLALFLNVYTIEITILSDLTYSTTGRTIRLAILPELYEAEAYQVNFDLKAQTHRLFVTTSEKVVSASTLEMPAINGNVRLRLEDDAVDASATVTMEKITLEGSAVYGMISILGATSTAKGFKAIQADVQTVTEDIKGTFPPTTVSRPSATQSKAIYFDIRGTLGGLAISADAPSVNVDTSTANLLFDVQTVHLQASNRAGESKPPLPFPQFRLAIDEITAELRQMENDKLRLAGRLSLLVLLDCSVDRKEDGTVSRVFRFSLTGPVVDLGAATAPVIVDILSHLQTRMKGLDVSVEQRYLRRLKKLEQRMTRKRSVAGTNEIEGTTGAERTQMTSSLTFNLQSMRISYITDDPSFRHEAREPHDLVLSLESVQLVTRSQAEAKLNMKDLQLALKRGSDTSANRPGTSALMPEVVFSVQHKASATERQLGFQAAGKALDIQLDPRFVLPASDLQRSLIISSKRLRLALRDLDMAPASGGGGGGVDAKKLLGDRNLSSLVVQADFAGATVNLQGSTRDEGRRSTLANIRSQRGRYGQFDNEGAASAKLRAPGVALRVQYADPGDVDPKLNVELRVDGSSNELNPSVVPLVMQVSDAVKKVVREEQESSGTKSGTPDTQESVDSKAAAYFDPEQTLVKADPKTLLGKTQLNLGIRICKQQFSLSCQPIAKVAASASIDDIYITINNIDSKVKDDQFFAASASFKGLNATLQHVYSRTITFSFDIDSILLSIMNSKHISGTSGISAILRIAPSKAQLNAKQLQDILLFREIWVPSEVRNPSRAAAAAETDEPQDYFMHRYQQIAASTAFSWNAVVAISELDLELDLGQSIGKVSAKMSNFWVNSTKSSTARQNLCVGIDSVDVSSSGRLSGFVDLDKLKIRTSIIWPGEEQINNAPLIQGAVGFDRLCVKVAFDYVAFAVADITSFEFIMYNVRNPKQRGADRLVAILDGDKVNVYCTVAAAALSLSLYQAFERLIDEKKSSYQQSLQDIEKFMRRKSSVYPPRAASMEPPALSRNANGIKGTPVSLQTDVVVTLRSLDVGAYPTTLLDQQILRGEASDIQARFAVALDEGMIHSGLGLTLGQLRVSLASTPHPTMPRTLGEISVDEVVKNARNARGGVILRVPKVVAAMQTWQRPEDNNIEYIFRSSFEGKIDVGWNYSRISFIRGMYATHTRTLASRLGKPLPEAAIRIKGGPEAPPVPVELGADAEESSEKAASAASSPDLNKTPSPEQQKITAEVALPESKYTYTPLEPPVIETPQLRDMGEATPPLEWVGLQRDKLPNVTHQIIIVTLLEVAKEVDDAYGKILGRV